MLHIEFTLQIRAAPQARTFFAKSCDIPYMQLMLWVRTRWASLYEFLNRTLLFRKVRTRLWITLSIFCDLIHSYRPSTILPNWQMRATKFLTWKRKIILTFIFVNGTGTSSSWCTKFSRYYVRHSLFFFSILTSILNFKEPASTKQTFSSSKEPSAFRTIPVLEYLKESWGNMANHPKFSEVENSIHKGIENLDKWYNKVNDTDAYFICLRMYPCNFIRLPNQMISSHFGSQFLIPMWKMHTHLTSGILNSIWKVWLDSRKWCVVASLSAWASLLLGWYSMISFLVWYLLHRTCPRNHSSHRNVM